MPAARAPTQAVARLATNHSGRLPARITTPLPGSTPSATRARAARCTASRYSRQLVSSHDPPRLRAMAGRSGWAAPRAGGPPAPRPSVHRREIYSLPAREALRMLRRPFLIALALLTLAAL